MTSVSQIEIDFRNELVSLLNKYKAELEASDHFQGYAECGEDIRMIVTIPGIWSSDGDVLREYTEINLGNRVSCD